MEQQTDFSFKDEFEKIATRSTVNYLKLGVGIHKIFVLSDPEKCFYTDHNTNETTAQIKLHVDYNKQNYLWTIPIGETESSLFGQLMFIGRIDNTLIGKELEVVVSTTQNFKGETVRKYQVLNYVRLKQQMQQD